MHIKKIVTTALLVVVFAVTALAQDGHPARSNVERPVFMGERSAEAYDLTVTAAAKLPVKATASTVNSEVFQNVVIPAGQNVLISSTLDYSSAGTVAITIQCLSCVSAASSLGAAGLTLQALWMVPNGSSYVATENKAASAFPYWDAGGALFNAYGSQFRLNLQNRGSQPITIQQVTIFCRGQ